MKIERTALDGVLLLLPTPHHDDRGLFTRTFDAAIGGELGWEPFVQDSQSRSRKGTIRGMHGRIGRGEAKLVRCARGAVHDVLVDARPESPTFGRQLPVLLDDSIAPDTLMVFETNTHAEAVRMLCGDFERLERPRRLRLGR